MKAFASLSSEGAMEFANSRVAEVARLTSAGT
jgi:hypothetical protein